MLVKLPGKISGKGLVVAIREATDQLQDVCKTKARPTYCYEPGSVKEALLSQHFDIFPTLLRKRGMFLWKRTERVTGEIRLTTSEIHTNEEYQTIDINAFFITGDYGAARLQPGSVGFEEARPVLEQFLELLYEKLQAPQTEAQPA